MPDITETFIMVEELESVLKKGLNGQGRMTEFMDPKRKYRQGVIKVIDMTRTPHRIEGYFVKDLGDRTRDIPFEGIRKGDNTFHLTYNVPPSPKSAPHRGAYGGGPPYINTPHGRQRNRPHRMFLR